MYITLVWISSPNRIYRPPAPPLGGGCSPRTTANNRRYICTRILLSSPIRINSKGTRRCVSISPASLPYQVLPTLVLVRQACVCLFSRSRGVLFIIHLYNTRPQFRFRPLPRRHCYLHQSDLCLSEAPPANRVCSASSSIPYTFYCRYSSPDNPCTRTTQYSTAPSGGCRYMVLKYNLPVAYSIQGILVLQFV